MKVDVTGSTTDATDVHKLAYLKSLILLIPMNISFSKILLSTGIIPPLIILIHPSSLPITI